MQHQITRRHFMPLAGLMASAVSAQPAPAETRVLLGFVLDNTNGAVVKGVLKSMQGHYAPEVSTRITYLPGNSSGLAIEAVAKAPADGATTIVMPSTLVTLTAQLRKQTGVDPLTDFLPVAAFGELTLAFVVGAAVPAQVKTLKDYTAWARQNPSQQNYGVIALGSSSHFVGAAVARQADLAGTPVSYKSLVSMVDDVSYGTVPAAVVPISSAAEAFAAGHVRLLAVASDERWPGFPDVPTLTELGVHDVQVVLSYGFYMRSETPPAQVQAFREAVVFACATAEVRAAQQFASMRPMRSSPADFPEAIVRERAVWAAVLKKQRFNMES